MATTVDAIAVIPARGGSKRIPRKNILPFLGVPLLARTVATLRESGVFKRIIVSTDDDEIAAVSTEAGAEVPFRRPAELSDDVTPTSHVIAHAIGALEAAGWSGSYVCCAYPAAVFATPDDFRQALATLAETPEADYVFTAAAFPYPVQRALRRDADGGCEMLWPEHRETRSQDLEPAFHDAGQFYVGTRQAWVEGRPIFSRASRMLVLPHYRVQDVDTADDWQRAEIIARLLAIDEG
jgi:N-acylneuraminate cytidylyltransferase